MKANKKSYSREFKNEAVRLSHSSDKNVDAIAESLGISKSTLHRWRNEFRDDPDQAFPGKGNLKERDAEIPFPLKTIRHPPPLE
jgi:transposase